MENSRKFWKKNKAIIHDLYRFWKYSNARKNWMQNSYKCYTNKYKKYVACIYDWNLVLVHHKISKAFESFLGKDAVYNFKSMIKESKYCTNMMKKLVMTEEDDEDFENSTKFGFVIMFMLKVMLK